MKANPDSENPRADDLFLQNPICIQIAKELDDAPSAGIRVTAKGW